MSTTSSSIDAIPAPGRNRCPRSILPPDGRNSVSTHTPRRSLDRFGEIAIDRHNRSVPVIGDRPSGTGAKFVASEADRIVNETGTGRPSRGLARMLGRWPTQRALIETGLSGNRRMPRSSSGPLLESASPSAMSRSSYICSRIRLPVVTTSSPGFRPAWSFGRLGDDRPSRCSPWPTRICRRSKRSAVPGFLDEDVSRAGRPRPSTSGG